MSFQASLREDVLGGFISLPAYLFLAALLDTLGTGVERTLAAGLGRHLPASLLVYDRLVLRLLNVVATRAFGGIVPARFFSRKALSSSSYSLACFLAAFKGLALPPVCGGVSQRIDGGVIGNRKKHGEGKSN